MTVHILALSLGRYLPILHPTSPWLKTVNCMLQQTRGYQHSLEIQGRADCFSLSSKDRLGRISSSPGDFSLFLLRPSFNGFDEAHPLYITSWETDGDTVETVSDFIFLGPKISADGDCSHEFKRRLLLGRKVMTNLDSILKSRDITLPTKVCLVKAMVFPVVMYGCESQMVKKAEHQRIDAFELWCWRRLLRAPWTARRSNQSILKEISPGCSLEGLMLKLKLQYFGYLM